MGSVWHFLLMINYFQPNNGGEYYYLTLLVDGKEVPNTKSIRYCNWKTPYLRYLPSLISGIYPAWSQVFTQPDLRHLPSLILRIYPAWSQVFTRLDHRYLPSLITGIYQAWSQVFIQLDLNLPSLISGIYPAWFQVFTQLDLRYLPSLISGIYPALSQVFTQLDLMYLPSLPECAAESLLCLGSYGKKGVHWFWKQIKRASKLFF